MKPCLPFNYYSSKTQILIRAVLVCALLFPLIRTRLHFLQGCSKFPEEWEQGGTALYFLHELILPSGGSQLANTQVPVICSKCVILASVALVLGRADCSHAVMCALLSLSLCPP